MHASIDWWGALQPHKRSNGPCSDRGPRVTIGEPLKGGERERKLQPRKEPPIIGQEVSVNGSHAEMQGPDEARLTLAVAAGPASVTEVRKALGNLIADGDPVVL